MWNLWHIIFMWRRTLADFQIYISVVLHYENDWFRVDGSFVSGLIIHLLLLVEAGGQVPVLSRHESGY